MSNYDSLSPPELDDRIAILRDNIRQLTEQAAASAGAANEERTADRIAQQQEELDELIKERTPGQRSRGPFLAGDCAHLTEINTPRG